MTTTKDLSRKASKNLVEITNSQKLYMYFLYTVLLALPGLFMFFYLVNMTTINVITSFNLSFFFIFVIPIICDLIIWLLYGRRESTILITEDKIEFYYLKHLFLMINWFEIKTTKIFKEYWETSYYRGRLGPKEYSGYTIQFIGLNLNKNVRLWCFPFNHKNQRLIISGLTEFSEKLDKEILIDESRRESLKLSDPKCQELYEFSKKYRFPKIKKKFGKV